MTMPRISTSLRTLLSVALMMLLATALHAQESQGLPASPLPAQSLRAYWHVFAAYSIVIVLIGGWAVSISRRLRSIEERLVD